MLYRILARSGSWDEYNEEMEGWCLLKLHFLNVGHGDCCIIEFPIDGGRRVAMIDINRTSEMDEETANEVLQEISSNERIYLEESRLIKAGLKSIGSLLREKGYNIQLTDPLTYLSSELNASSVFRFISTHPHLDHLSGLHQLSNEFSIINMWVLKNDFTVDCSELSDSQKKDWEFYTKYRDGGGDDKITVIRPEEGSQADMYTQDGISILAPNKDLLKQAKDKDNKNIMSYVLLIKYGECKIVLGGDAEQSTWEYLCQNYETDLKDVTILKASHHGRDSGYYQPAVKLMNPEYTVVSVGKKPTTDASNKYRNYSENVWSTRWKGNITFECESDGSVTYKAQYNR